MSYTLRQRVSELEEEVENLWFENEQLRAIAEHCLMGATEPERAKPGIGAVVAMVAAARMALGGWYGVLRRSTSPVTHWDFAPAWMTNNALPACGDCWRFDHGIAAGIDDVDCADCLAIARRAGLMREAP